MEYRQEYQELLDMVGGDEEWMEMHGWVHPDALVDGGDDELPPAASEA